MAGFDTNIAAYFHIVGWFRHHAWLYYKCVILVGKLSIVADYITTIVICLVYYWSDAIIVCHTQFGSSILGLFLLLLFLTPYG